MSRSQNNGPYFRSFGPAVVLDVETTGLSPGTDRILTIAMFRYDFSYLKRGPENLSGYLMEEAFNPQISIPDASTRIHGITDADVAGCPTFSEKAQEIREFIGNLPVIAHNASFDRNFLNAKFRRSGIKTLNRNKSFCTMRRFQYEIGQLAGSTLEKTAHALGIPGRTGAQHGASEDMGIALQIAVAFYMQDNRLIRNS